MPFGFFNSGYNQNRNQQMQRGQVWGQQQMPPRQWQAQPQRQQPQQMRSQTPQAQPNKPLPDGVNYQPLDEKTLAEIRRVVPNHPGLTMLPQSNEQGSQVAPIQEPQADPQAAFTPPMPAFDSRVVKALENFIQGEHNGAKFYDNLASRATSDRQKKIVSGVCESCKKRGNGYNNLYRNFTDTDFNVSDVELMGVRSFRDGVYAAIYEENTSLRELSDLFGEVNDEPTNRALMSALYRKVSDINFLQLALHD